MQALHGLLPSSDVLYASYEDHLVFVFDIPRDCAANLVHTYGTLSLRVAEHGLAHSTSKQTLNQRLHPDYPYLRSELAYAISQEMCEKPNDVLCRRVPIAFLNKSLALQLLPEVVEMMAKEKKWSSSQKKQELEEARRMLEFMK